MKTSTLAKILQYEARCGSRMLSETIVHRIVPPHCRDEATYATLDDIFEQVKVLYGKFYELNQLLPANCEKHSHQLVERVMKLSAQFLESIEVEP